MYGENTFRGFGWFFCRLGCFFLVS